MASQFRRNTKRFVDADLMTSLDPSTSQFIDQVNQTFSIVPRKWQSQAMQALLGGNNVLVRAGTGSGKSLIFEAMTMAKPGAVVLVISPLIALMHNQVSAPRGKFR
jgi:superfamily II DNA helicase RecQ